MLGLLAPDNSASSDGAYQPASVSSCWRRISQHSLRAPQPVRNREHRPLTFARSCCCCVIRARVQYKGTTSVWQPKHGSICFPLRWVQLKKKKKKTHGWRTPLTETTALTSRRHTPLISYSSRAQQRPAVKTVVDASAAREELMLSASPHCETRLAARSADETTTTVGRRAHPHTMTVPARAIAQPMTK